MRHALHEGFLAGTGVLSSTGPQTVTAVPNPWPASLPIVMTSGQVNIGQTVQEVSNLSRQLERQMVTRFDASDLRGSDFAGVAARTVLTAIRFQSSAVCGEIVAAVARDGWAPPPPASTASTATTVTRSAAARRAI